VTAKTGERLIIEERGDIRSSIGDTVRLNSETRHIYVFDKDNETRIC
jgi:lactose/L-arabinose transport system ATP-binding protein